VKRSKVAVLQTAPASVLADYHELMNLAGYQDVIARDADTALEINLSWHFFYPSSSTTPWQLEGVIRAMKRDGYDPNRIHGCHNRTVVIDAHLGERGKVETDPEGRGYPDVGSEQPELVRAGIKHFLEGVRLVGMAVKESPELKARKRSAERALVQ